MLLLVIDVDALRAITADSRVLRSLVDLKWGVFDSNTAAFIGRKS